ncbi:MAG: methylmalonyl-CoA/ethylmalonyl-CoA epimerase [Bacteroidia bacterium]|jgi:methylmalonyl-CoA/ethylmalonyl-CoA epimerase
MEHIEHIGIAVRDLEQSILVYERLLNTKCYKREEVASENVITAFFRAGNNKIELLQATSEESAIHSFIEKRGEGIHHIAYSVKNIESEMVRLKSEGFRLLNTVPKKGADNKLICFVHPKDASGVLTELCQEISE